MTNLTPLRGRYQATKQMENPASRQTVTPQAAMMPKQTMPTAMKPPKPPKMPAIKPPKPPTASQSFAKVPTPGMPKMGSAMEKEAWLSTLRGGLAAARAGFKSGGIRKGVNAAAKLWKSGGGLSPKAAKAIVHAPEAAATAGKIGISQYAKQLPEKMSFGRRIASMATGSPNLYRNTYKIKGGRTVAANGAVGRALVREGATRTSRGLVPRMARMGAYGGGGSYALSLGARPPKKAADYYSKRRLKDAALTAAGTVGLGSGLAGGAYLAGGGSSLLGRGLVRSTDTGKAIGRVASKSAPVRFRHQGVKGVTV